MIDLNRRQALFTHEGSGLGLDNTRQRNRGELRIIDAALQYIDAVCNDGDMIQMR